MAIAAKEERKAMKNYGLRWGDEDWKRFTKCAHLESMRTGFPVSISDVIRKFALAGVQEWEKAQARMDKVRGVRV